MLILELRGEAKGAKRVLRTMHSTIQGMMFSGRNLTASDVGYLNSQVQNHAGQAAMGKIEQIVQGLISRLPPYHFYSARNYKYFKRDDFRDLYTLITAYIEISHLRKSVLLMAREHYLSTSLTNSAERAVKHVISQIAAEDQWIKFLAEPRTGNQIMVVAAYHGDVILDTYLESRNWHPYRVNKALVQKRCFKATQTENGGDYLKLYQESSRCSLKRNTNGERSIRTRINVVRSASNPESVNLRVRYPYRRQEGPYQIFHNTKDPRSVQVTASFKSTHPAADFIVVPIKDGKNALVVIEKDNGRMYFLESNYLGACSFGQKYNAFGKLCDQSRIDRILQFYVNEC